MLFRVLPLLIFIHFDLFLDRDSIDLIWPQIESQPGPASTEVEHSLRKISIQGDRGSILAEDFSFQTLSYFLLNKNFAQMFDRIFQLSDKLQSRNLDRKELLRLLSV